MRTLADGKPFNAHRSQDAGAHRLRPGQPARRPSRRGTGRPDGGGRPRRRRSAGARGRRLRPRRQRAVLALPRSRAAAGAAHPRRQDAATRYTGIGGNVPQIAGQPGVPGHPGGPRRRRADRRRRNLAHPNAIARPRRQAGLDEPGRVGADRRGRRRRRADGRARRAPDQAGPAGVCLSDVRAGAADRGGRVAGRAPPPHRRAVGAVQRGGRGRIRTPGAENRCPPSRSGSRARTTG